MYTCMYVRELNYRREEKYEFLLVGIAKLMEIFSSFSVSLLFSFLYWTTLQGQ